LSFAVRLNSPMISFSVNTPSRGAIRAFLYSHQQGMKAV
jgi:hypothetical protein